MIVAILFVKAVGFGALAGILALTVASIGFVAKLFAEAIEEISLKQVEAVRATGASFMNVIAVRRDAAGARAASSASSTYQLDSNLRNSTMVGIVGAGGIGGTLFAAFQRFDYDFVLRDPDHDHRDDHGRRSAGELRIETGRINRRSARRIDAATTWQRYHAAPSVCARFAIYFGHRRGDRRSRCGRSRSSRSSCYDAPEQMADLCRRMWPIAWAFYPERRARRADRDAAHRLARARCWRSLMALPLGVLAAHNVTPERRRSTTSRKLMLVSSRSVNSLVWALLSSRSSARARSPARLAIAFRSIGFVGKLFGEALEEARRADRGADGGRRAVARALVNGYWPQVEPAFWAIALFRWDINVRESAVLGLVGAGGIGMAIDTAMNLFQWDRVALMLVAIFAVVVVAEIVVTQLRKRII